jgi:hypothetical protein
MDELMKVEGLGRLQEILDKIALMAWGMKTEPLTEIEASRLMDTILENATYSVSVCAQKANKKAHWKYEHRDDGEYDD